MNVSLVSVTTPVVPGINTAEEGIVYCARVSNPSNQLNTETGSKLLKYCLDHGHYSVFEMANFCVEVETSRAIAAQILRHWSLSVQEFSQRYSTADLGFEPLEPRRQGVTNRQSSTDDLDPELVIWFKTEAEILQQRAKWLYETAISKGIAKESARFVLPLNTTTRMYLNGSVRDWIFYLRARTDLTAQREHRDVAEAIRAVFSEQFPTIAGLLDA